jgi:uncharacterized membrane protein (UPF0127 family)
MKRFTQVLIAIGLIAGLGWALTSGLFFPRPVPYALSFDGAIIHLEIASTAAQQEQGLGGRDSLAQDSGMLFVFIHSSRYPFWMKDMRFPLDIIWLDSSFSVVHVKKHASPESFPELFTPSRDALYALEVNAGVADRLGISDGVTLTPLFQN